MTTDDGAVTPNPEFTGAHLWASACNVVLGLVKEERKA